MWISPHVTPQPVRDASDVRSTSADGGFSGRCFPEGASSTVTDPAWLIVEGCIGNHSLFCCAVGPDSSFSEEPCSGGVQKQLLDWLT